MTLELFENSDSPNCHKVRLLLSALGQPWLSRTVDLFAGGTRDPGFLALNSQGQVPVLIDGDVRLPESNAILYYLAERYAPERLGRSRVERAQVQRWLFWVTAGHMRPLAAVGLELQIRPLRGQSPDHAIVEREAAAWFEKARLVDEHLAERCWLVGNDWTIADLGVGVWFELASHLGLLGELGRARAWVARLTAQDFWQRTPGYRLTRPERTHDERLPGRSSSPGEIPINEKEIRP